jgi:hypothetical protein
VTHGHTFCSVETFEEVVKAVADCGFTTSDLPVILSLKVSARHEASACTHARRVRATPPTLMLRLAEHVFGCADALLAKAAVQARTNHGAAHGSCSAFGVPLCAIRTPRYQTAPFI